MRCGEHAFATRASDVYIPESGSAKLSADVLRALCWNDSNMYSQICSTSLTTKSSLFHRCVSLVLHPPHWVCRPPEGVKLFVGMILHLCFCSSNGVKCRAQSPAEAACSSRARWRAADYESCVLITLSPAVTSWVWVVTTVLGIPFICVMWEEQNCGKGLT